MTSAYPTPPRVGTAFLDRDHFVVPVWVLGVSQERGGLPAGVVLRHGPHGVVLPWAEVAGLYAVPGRWTLESLTPLTLAEPVRCPGCGVTGTVTGGRWVPASSSD